MPYPSSTTYPSSTISPTTTSTTSGTSTATVTGGLYPGATTSPGATTYPGIASTTGGGGGGGGTGTGVGITPFIGEPLSDFGAAGTTVDPLVEPITEPIGGAVVGGGTGGPPIVFASNRIRWDNPLDREFETGLDRGVLYLTDGTAVPWNGLISIDENGGDSSETYYMDGRPYLIVPKPKEFTATLRAYTYPDEFAPAMGLVEAADGAYLDSQMGEMFALSYRTLIGNAVNGEQAGYKIHLIYNATVAPPASSSTSLSDSVNPNELSWDIQAVPVAIPGHRPTAHIIIDTRHMSFDRLQIIEALLYGTGNSGPTMPSAATILNLVSYGGVITITDNGDGTWTAEGALDNVHMLDDYVFEITSVDAVDHGDGTYTITTTTLL